MIRKGKKISVVQAFRAATQIAFFLLLPALFINAYAGVRLLAEALIHGNVNLANYMPQIVSAVAIVPATALLGRFFCGWMCAFGALGDLVHGLFSRFVKFRMSEKLDRALKPVKYVLLAGFVALFWVIGAKTVSSANPWDAFGMLAVVGKTPDIAFVLQSLLPGFVLLLLVLAGSVFVERFFCRYFCPLGALFAVVSHLKLIRIRKPSAQCGKCQACTRSCAMGIPLYKMDSVASGECIACLKCLQACPRKNPTVAFAGSDLRPAVAGAVAVAALTGAYYGGSVEWNLASPTAIVALQNPQSTPATDPANTAISTQDTTPQPSATPATEPAAATASAAEATQTPAQTQQSASIYKNGTYQGSGRGFRGATTVSVTIQNDKITGIDVVSYRDDPQFFQTAFPTVSEEIIQAQSLQVDTVSGATFSSRGILTAVEEALNKAKL